jgi:hypothetical protein
MKLEFILVNAQKFISQITASSDTVKSEGRQMKQCRITYIKKLFIRKVDQLF